MNFLTIATQPIAGQRPGTSGLRKKVQRVPAAGLPRELRAVDLRRRSRLRRRRRWCSAATAATSTTAPSRPSLRMAAANGFGRVLVGQGGILSTPGGQLRDPQPRRLRRHHPVGQPQPRRARRRLRHQVQRRQRRPGARDVTEAIYQRTQAIDRYLIVEAPDVDLTALGTTQLGGMTVEVIDPVADYAAPDGARCSTSTPSGALLARAASACASTPCTPSPAPTPRSAGRAPGRAARPVSSTACRCRTSAAATPTPTRPMPHELVAAMFADDAPDFGAASDGDGDRNMIVGRRFIVTPSDSLAVLAANAHLVPGYAAGLKGVARSMPTSAAVDRVAAALGIPCYETPTGWKFFGNLLDAGRITLCGEESAGTGTDHVREKDGLWAVLFWLNILAVRGESVEAIVRDHWRRFGRNYLFAPRLRGRRQPAAAKALMERAARRVARPARPDASDRARVTLADDFAYTDPVDGSVSTRQGLRIGFEDGSRIVFRLSGTGTEGATLRVYLERYEPDCAPRHRDAAGAGGLDRRRRATGRHRGRTGRTQPTVIT